jgi:quercetin dioxygenase-like cupin family protein
MDVKRSVLVTAFLLTSAGSAVAQQSTPTEASAHVIVAVPDGIEWGPAPASLPSGAQLAVIEGDPNAQGEFTMRLRMPAGYRIPPHFHRATEHVTVLQGTFYVGMGETFDASKGSGLPTGTFGAIPPGMRHFAWTDGEEVIIQLHGNGPWGIYYVDEADDPRRR